MDSKTLNNIDIIGLKESINAFIKKETQMTPAKRLAKAYIKKIDNGENADLLAESFVKEFSAVANSVPAQNTIDAISFKVNESKRDLSIITNLKTIEAEQPYIVPMVESVVVNYLTDKTVDNRNKLKYNLNLFENLKEVKNILLCLSYDEYDEQSGKKLNNVKLLESADSTKSTDNKKTYSQEEVDKLVEDAKKDAQNTKNDKVEEKSKVTESINTHINLYNTISKISHNTQNESVKVLCEQYLNALNNGKPETLLYETFISAASKYNYLPAVDTELSALGDRISKYKQNIDLRKILEIMKETSSYYLVPLIEDVVADYCDKKNVNTRVVLKNRLQAYEGDPYVRDIINIVEHDDSIPNTVVLGESVEALNPYVHTELVFSPVQYIKENECVFNVCGSYYIRKNKNISRLSNRETNNLSESFKTLCDLVNSNNVKISKEENSITVYDGMNKAVINESEININGEKIAESELDKLAFNSYAFDDGDERFYRNVKTINENFNNIAYINFVKRVTSNKADGRAVDVFRLDNNIFVGLINENLGVKTFYSNVNPIQCRNFINEHMGLNISPLFEDILPGQQTILEGINDTKKEFEDYLEELNTNRNKLADLRECNEDSTEEIDAAIAAIDDEIKDTKEKYNKYTKDSEKFTKGDDQDKNSTLDQEVSDTEGDADSQNTDDSNTDDMEMPIEQDLDNTIDAAISIASEPDTEEETPDEFADVEEFGEFDTPSLGNTDNTDPYNFEVLRVNYLENLKTGESCGKGDVIVVIPSVDADGNVHDETKRVTFYLSPEREPIINNEYMPANMYVAIKDAILADPRTETVELESEKTTIDKNKNNTDNTPTDIMFSDSDVDPENFKFSDYEDTNTENDNNNEFDDFDFSQIDSDDTYTDRSSDKKPVQRESPAKTSDTNVESYPISLDLNPEDIKPISKDELEDDMDDLGIEHSESESEEGSVCIKLNDKSQVRGLFKYFNRWKNWNKEQFKQFFPELKSYMNNNGSIPVQATNEGVQIRNVKCLHESNSNRYVFPYKKEYLNVLHLDETKGHPDFIRVTFENNDELYEAYQGFKKLSKKMKVDENVRQFLLSNDKRITKLLESEQYSTVLPYNSFLDQKLIAKRIPVTRLNENMLISLNKENVRPAKKIFENYFKKNMPVDLARYLVYTGKSLNESFKIDITDENTGKTVTVYASDKGNDVQESTNSIEQPDFNSSFRSAETTFKPDESFEYKEDELERKEEEKKKNDKEKDNNNDSSSKTNEDDNNDDNNDDKKETKKKFTFRKSKANESLLINNIAHSLNEAEQASLKKIAKPNVYDEVTFHNGKRGQIICQMGNGNYIVSSAGHTIEVTPKEVKMRYNRPDVLDCPYKFDKESLRGIFEQMVPCGMFMNGMQITQSNSYIKFADYVNAKSDDEVDMIIEGNTSKVKRSYLKLLESIDTFANIYDYIEGYIVNENGVEQNHILVNKNDFNQYINESIETNPVRVLIFDENGSTKLINMSGTAIKLK